MRKATAATAGSSPLTKLSLSKVKAALPELTDGLLARSRVTPPSFRGLPNIVA